jgi:hypothetical protein
MIPIKSLREQGVRDTKFSLNWQRFQQLKNMILETTGEMKILYDGTLYTGIFKEFRFAEDANTPFNIDYTFTFDAYPNRIVNIAAPNTLFRQLPVLGSILSNTANMPYRAGISTK